MTMATATSTVYLIVKSGECQHEGGEIVAVFGTKAEAQGFCSKHADRFWWTPRRVWAWPEIVDPSLPGYYAGSFDETPEYDLARPPRPPAEATTDA